VERSLERAVSRRSFLTAAGVLTAGAAFALGNTRCSTAVIRRLAQSDAALPLRHAAWVWQFSIDGAISDIAPALARNNMAVIVKTHDGVDWMSKFDPVPGAIDGPDGVARVRASFEEYGVPFHAWCVVKGEDPVAEARMAAQVLDAGARSITLDLESGPGFWAGTPDGALRFGEELRRLHAFGRVDVSIDPRPWKMLDVPLGEFNEFVDGIRPQMYWDIFDTPDNARSYTYMGFPPDNGITPEFLASATRTLLAPFDRWVVPIAEGSSPPSAWTRFLGAAVEHQMPVMNVWRFGTADPAVLDFLGAHPPGTAPVV